MKSRFNLLILLICLGLLFCGFTKNVKENIEKSNQGQEIMYDYHMHIFSKDLNKTINGFMPPEIQNGDCSAKAIISLMDEANVKRAFVLSGAYLYGANEIADKNEYENVKRENNYLAAQVAKYPHRLVGFVSVNPLKDYAIQEIERGYKELNLQGIKIHCTNSNVSLRNPKNLEKMKKIFEKAQDLNMPILIHLRSRDAAYGKEDIQIFLNDLVAKYPNVKLQIAHLGGYGGFDDATKEAFRTLIVEYNTNSKLSKKNIYLDISAVIATEKEKLLLPPTSEAELKELTHMLREWGLDHIVWGSDSPTITSLNSKEYIKKTGLTKNELKAVFNNDIYKEFFKDNKER